MKKTTAVAFVGLLLASAPLWAASDGAGEGSGLPVSLSEESISKPTDLDVEGEFVPSPTLAVEPRVEDFPRLSIGAAVGYLNPKGADHGTWFAGVQGRLHFMRYFAAEASITFHSNRYENGDVHVTQYPVQVSGMVYPFPEWKLKPYALAGVGWYYTRITYTGTFSSISNQTEHVFGAHVGVGGELYLGPSTSIDADLRYIWLNPNSHVVNKNDFDYWQVTGGINFFF
jgi:hypothetical protein